MREKDWLIRCKSQLETEKTMRWVVNEIPGSHGQIRPDTLLASQTGWRLAERNSKHRSEPAMELSAARVDERIKTLSLLNPSTFRTTGIPAIPAAAFSLW